MEELANKREENINPIIMQIFLNRKRNVLVVQTNRFLEAK